MTACTIVEHSAPAFAASSLDLDGCSRLEIARALNEFELKAEGLAHRFDSWPDSVRRDFEKILADWHARNANRTVVLQSSAIWRGVALLILHHAAK
jgi:hypothetical protein